MRATTANLETLTAACDAWFGDDVSLRFEHHTVVVSVLASDYDSSWMNELARLDVRALTDPRCDELAGLVAELSAAARDAEHIDTGLSVHLVSVTRRWQQAGSPVDGPKRDAVTAARRPRAAHRRTTRDLLADAKAARRASTRQVAQRRRVVGQIGDLVDALITDHQITPAP